MKQSTITIRIDKELKNDFNKSCALNNTYMSESLTDHIKREVDKYKESLNKDNYTYFLESLGYDNIHIIDNTTHEINGDTWQTGVFKGTINEILSTLENKQIYIYVNGSDIKNNYWRLFAI